jgi:hypothetical protein
LSRTVEKEEVSDSNRLLFSILANNKFLDWLAEYSRKNPKASKEQYAQDLVQAAVKFGDKNIIASISKFLVANKGIPGLGDVAQQILINNAAGQTFATPVNQPSTSDQSLKSSQNFNGLGFGHLGHVFDPAFMRSVIESLVNKAKDLSKAGQLQNMKSKII